MVLTIRFVGSFRSMLGKSSLNFEIEDIIPLKNVLTKIKGEVSNFKEITMDLKTNMLILINGKEISVLSGLNTLLKDGDEIVFLPIVHGG